MTNLTEDDVRRIAREEAQSVATLEVDDPDGEGWSLGRFIDEFELSRREGLKALGLVALGYSGTEAVRRIAIEPASAAPADDLTVPGQLTVQGSVDLSGVTGTVDLTSAGTVKLGGDLEVRPSTTHPGSDTDPAIEVGNDGAGFYVFNNNGDMQVVHEDGSVNGL